MPMVLTFVDWVKLFGFLLVIVATVIATVKIPAIDKKISNATEVIINFRDYRILTALSKLDNEAHLIQRMLMLSEANQVIYADGPAERVSELRQKALDKTIGLAEWTNIEDKEDTKKKISEILTNTILTIEDKIKEVEKILDANRAAESARLERKHLERNENKAMKENLEINRMLWTKWFACLQISGLILFSGAEIMDKLLKWLSSIK